MSNLFMLQAVLAACVISTIVAVVSWGICQSTMNDGFKISLSVICNLFLVLSMTFWFVNWMK